MKKNRLRFCVLLMFLIINIVTSFSQVNISFNYNCSNKNCSMIADAFIEALGVKDVEIFIKNNVKFQIVLQTDSLGKVKKVLRFISDKKIPRNKIKKVANGLLNGNYKFFLCYEDVYSDFDKEYNLIRSTNNDIINNKIQISTGFPGALMMPYGLEEIPISKINFLIKQVKFYLTSNINENKKY